MRFPYVELVSGVALVLAFATGCGSDESGSSGKTLPKAVGQRGGAVAAPATVEQLAARMGCTPQFRGRAADYRQAICVALSGKYVINTFSTDKAQRDWLEYSKMYGGAYLVGTRWVVVSSPRSLEPLRGRLGGRIETVTDKPQ